MPVPLVLHGTPQFGNSGTEDLNGNGIKTVNKQDTTSSSFEVQIFDIRSSKDAFNIRADIVAGLQIPDGQEKTLPTMLLYDSAGLKHFERITYAEEYYLTNAEIEVLETYADAMAERIEDGGILVELGSGNLRKVNILLQALERAQKSVSYYALDLSLPELQRTFSALPGNTFKYVKCYGLHGTYDDGRKWLSSNTGVKDKPKCILWMGSSIGNFDKADAMAFLKQFSDEVLRPGSKDVMLIGIDACQNPDKVYRAYNDAGKITEDFIMNGLDNANGVLGEKVFDKAAWDYVGEYNVDNHRHEAFFKARKEIHLGGTMGSVVIHKDEKIRIERSYKYSLKQSDELWEKAGLSHGAKWGLANGQYHLHMVYKPAFIISLDPKEYATVSMPTLDDWKELWAAWDLVSSRMIPKDQLHSKPIELRNPCVFYLGHIPTFLDIHLSRATGQPATEPKNYQQIFERGIDPDVDDPDHCHSHSEIPDVWPDVDEILSFQERVRARLLELYHSGQFADNIGLQRSIWLAFEHEIMHLETLLYMLLQHDQALPPPGVPKPDFEALAAENQFSADETSEPWLDIPSSTICIGSSEDEEHGGFFTWDNEYPQRKVRVKAFQTCPRPITNGEYAKFLKATNSTSTPESWSLNRDTTADGHFKGAIKADAVSLSRWSVKTVFGHVPLELAKAWPVMASYDEIYQCAQWLGGRIPTREELQAVYEHVEASSANLDAQKLAARFSAVNGHLSMNGVAITPPSKSLSSEEEMEKDRSALFADLSRANVSFKKWHPTSVVGKVCGRATGGVWEWTSSVLAKHDGFKPMDLYPLYTADFFDEKHNVVLGGSWATHSRVAGRKSFVNWYQRNYRYTWCTARIVRDI